LKGEDDSRTGRPPFSRRRPEVRTIELSGQRRASGSVVRAEVPVFEERFTELFESHFPKVFRILDRLSGDPEMAADLSQEAFVRLYRRGSLPDSPASWLVSVAMNLLRNEMGKRSRRFRLLSLFRAEASIADAAPSPAGAALAEGERRQVQAALDRLPDRDRRLLLLKAEGFSYREIAEALNLNPASMGTLIARAKERFRQALTEDSDAP